MTPVARADVGGVLIRGCRGRSQLPQIVPPFKAASRREPNHAGDGGRDPSLRAMRFLKTSACAEISKMKEMLWRRAAHNGLEMSRPPTQAILA